MFVDFATVLTSLDIKRPITTGFHWCMMWIRFKCSISVWVWCWFVVSVGRLSRSGFGFKTGRPFSTRAWPLNVGLMLIWEKRVWMSSYKEKKPGHSPVLFVTARKVERSQAAQVCSPVPRRGLLRVATGSSPSTISEGRKSVHVTPMKRPHTISNVMIFDF